MNAILAAVAFVTCPLPYAYDGDAIRCHSAFWQRLAGNRSMRLIAIDAPEIRCPKRPRRPCSTKGAIPARDRLRALIGSGPVMCAWTGTRNRDRLIVRCTVSGRDLSCLQLASPNVTYWPRYDAGGRLKRECSSIVTGSETTRETL